MSYAIVSHLEAALGQNGGTTGSLDTSGANLLVVAVAADAGAAPTLTDSKGNTWRALTRRSTSTATVRMYYALNPTVGTGHTFSLAGADEYSAIAIVALSGGDTVRPFDTETGATSASGTTVAPGSLTPITDNCILVTAVATGTAGTPTIDGGFTAVGGVSFVAAVNYGIRTAYLIQTSAAAANPTWTVPSGASAAAMASFALSEGGGGSRGIMTGGRL